MRRILSALAIFIILPAFAAKPCAIMPVGDSMTWGHGWTPGARVGYRLALWNQLQAAGYSIDFVGGMEQDSEGGTIPPAFDDDHEGHPGWRTEEDADHIYEWLSVNPADIILLMVGTNNIGRGDAPEATIASYARLLDEVDRYSPATWVIVAQIPNRAPYSPATTEFNVMLGNLVRERIADGDRLRLVDMESALLSDDLYDGVHPATSGYQKMAAVWYEAVVPLVESCAVPPVGCNLYFPVIGK